MGTTLTNGIYLPNEGEKNCYQGLAGNWNKVDGALGDVAELKQSIESKFTKEIVTELPTEDINPFCIYMILKTDPETDNVYDEWVYINNNWEYLGNTKVDMTQYYTKQEVNQLPAVASGVTATKVGNYDAHIANGDIHVTASDKTKWNTVALIKQLRLVNTQVGSATTIAFANIDDTNGIKVGDKCMDLDAKMFEITAVDTTNQTVTVGTALIDLALDANVMHLSGNETVAGIKTFSDIPIFATFDGIRFRCAHNSGAYVTFRNTNQANPGSIIFSANDGNVSTAFHLVDKTLTPYTNGDIDLGTSLRKWKSLNGINPGALSLPDLDNGIDISGYITDLTGDSYNSYTPLVDGYISLRVNGTNACAIYVLQGDVGTSSYGNIVDVDLGGFICLFFIPVVKNVACRIVCRRVQTIVYAKFFPCLGNV